MTVTNDSSKQAPYQGPRSIGDKLPFYFPYRDKTDVKVKVGDSILEINTGYEIEAGEDDQGHQCQTVKLKVAVEAEDLITIYRETPVDQQSVYPQNAKFRSEQVESDFDKLCMIQQEQQEALGRCIQAPIETVSTFNWQLPVVDAEVDAGKGLMISEDGAGITYTDYPMAELQDIQTAKEAAEEAAEEAEQAAEEAEQAAAQYVDSVLDNVQAQGNIVYSVSGTTVTLGTKAYTHSQAVASDTWNITHNLNKPCVKATFVASDGSVFYPQVKIVNNNTCQALLIGAMGGTAYLE